MAGGPDGRERARACGTMAAVSAHFARRVHLVVAGLLAATSLALVWTWARQLGGGNLPVAGDAFYTFAAARSLAWDGDIDLTNQLMVLGDRWGLGQAPANDGVRLPVRELGPALLMVPGLVVHALLHASPATAPQYAATLGSLSLGACVLALGWAMRRADPDAHPTDWLVSTLTPLAFVVPFYAIGQVGYAHAPDAVMCTLVFGCLAGARGQGSSSPATSGPATSGAAASGAAASGAAVAAAVLFRLQNALWLLWPALDAVARWRARASTATSSHLQGRGGGVLPLVAVASLGAAPQLYAALAHPGSDTGAIRWGLDFFDVDGLGNDLLTVLLGRHGMWRETPVALVATVGLALTAVARPSEASGSAAAIQRRQLARRSFTVAAALVLLMACTRDPHGGHAFGARRLAGCTPILAFGVLQMLRRLRARGSTALWLTWLGLAGLTVWNVVITLGSIAGTRSIAP